MWCARGVFFFLEKLVQRLLTLYCAVLNCYLVQVKYLNRNAFIMTAMLGTGFLKSSKEAFRLITANIVRGFVVSQANILSFCSALNVNYTEL